MLKTLLEYITNTIAKDATKHGITTRYIDSEDIIFRNGGLHGYRQDLKHFMKSRMEANVYRFYRWKFRNGKIKVEYEPDTFRFKPNKFGIKYYCPDFKISSPQGVHYIEVKGKLDDTSIKKAWLLSKEYSGIKLYFIFPKQYNLIRKYYAKKIPYWEGGDI